MTDIGARYQPEIAIINITPHLSGQDAARAVWATRAEVVIPVHFGAYDYIFFGSLKSPRGYDDVRDLIERQAVLLQQGESLSIEREVRRAAGQNPMPRPE